MHGFTGIVSPWVQDDLPISIGEQALMTVEDVYNERNRGGRVDIKCSK
jgi:hypothetical protein